MLVFTFLAACAGTAAESEPDPIERIAFGSCAFQWEPQPVWDAVRAVEPDLFIFLGDAIYGDYDGEKVVDVSATHLQTQWQRLAEHPEFQKLREEVPLLAVWDNHDYGTHDGGADFELKAESKELFLDFFGEPARSERRRTPGIYHAEVFGPVGRRVQVLLLDTRWFKGPAALAQHPDGAGGSLGKYAPNLDPDATLLGAAQWAWLEEQLREPAELRLIVSGGQVVPDQKGMDEWGNYPHERRRLFESIAATGANGVVILSGNVHFAELSRTDDGPYPLLDFTSSGLTHVDEAYTMVENPYRIAGPCADINFGLVTIDWAATPESIVTLTAHRVDGSVAFEHRVPLEQLGSGD